MKTYTISLLVLSVSLFMSCNSTKNNTPNLSQMNGKWVLETIDGKNAKEYFGGKQPTMEINTTTSHISGTGGCNGYSGTYNLNKNIFSAPNLASTMMLCPNSTQEGEFTKILSKESLIEVRTSEETGDKSLIFIQNNNQVLVFGNEKPLTSNDLSGEWKLNSIEGASTSVHFKEEAATPTLQFNFTDKRISGFAGCNRYSGTFDLTNNQIIIQPLMATKMACSEMEGENKFLSTLPGTYVLELSNDLLLLKNDGRTIFTFQKSN